MKMTITFDEFLKLEIKVGEILNVREHPNADKLLILEVDTGEKRQLVAGIKDYYPAKELKGKRIIVLCNLEPREIRGVKSEGMLLAAEDKRGVSLLIPDRKRERGVRIR